MRRKVVTLSRDTVLWEAGDASRELAVVEAGKLGVRAGSGLVGIVLPGMVLGESALFSEEGGRDSRSAAIFALEDGTQVTLYPAADVRNAVEAGDDSLVRKVMTNLIGQLSRNLLMVVAAKRGYPFIDDPLLGLVRGVLRDAQQAPAIQSQANLWLTCRFLYDLRDLSDRVLEQLGPDPSLRAEMIVNASQVLTQFSEGKDLRPLVEAFLAAEKEKTEWWARGRHEGDRP
jgi:hypothetical protein